jgi:hypothetical protein
MVKSNSGAAPAVSLTLKSSGDKWADKSGVRVIIESYRFNRVTFYREGLCIAVHLPGTRFIKEFQPVREVKP